MLARIAFSRQPAVLMYLCNVLAKAMRGEEHLGTNWAEVLFGSFSTVGAIPLVHPSHMAKQVGCLCRHIATNRAGDILARADRNPPEIKAALMVAEVLLGLGFIGAGRTLQSVLILDMQIKGTQHVGLEFTLTAEVCAVHECLVPLHDNQLRPLPAALQADEITTAQFP